MGAKIGLKGEKYPIAWDVEGEFLQFVPETLEKPPLHFSDDQFAPLIQNLATKLKKTIFVDQFHTVPSTFRLSLPKIMGQVCYFVTHPHQF